MQQAGNVVRGSSDGGVSFTLTVYAHRSAARRAFAAGSPVSSVLLGDAVVDFAGDPAALPGSAPGRLSKGALATIRGCLAHP